MSNELVSIQDAAEITGLTVETLRMMVENGELSADAAPITHSMLIRSEIEGLNVHVIEFFSNFSDELKSMENDILRGKNK